MLFFVHRRRARRHLGASARCLWRKMHLRPHSLETLRSFRIFPPRCGYGCGCGCSVDVSVGVGVGVGVGERERDRPHGRVDMLGSETGFSLVNRVLVSSN